MDDKSFSGNKGEWSEPYVVLRLLSDGKLHQADKDLKPILTDFATILELSRSDVAARIEGDGRILFIRPEEKGAAPTVQVKQKDLRRQAQRLFKAISAIEGTSGAFVLPQEVEALKALGFTKLTNPAPVKRKTQKRDLALKISGSHTGVATLGFSVKSEIGSPPTLLNASEPTNIIYRVKGLTAKQAEAINAIAGSRKIMDRCRAIKESATSIEFEKYHSAVFADNLEIVDAALPKMIADLVKVHYFEQILLPRETKRSGSLREADRLDAAVTMLSNSSVYGSKKRKDFCEIKIKRFLRACALGLMPSEEWNGNEDASGGYIIVLPDGQLVALYVYNTNIFEKYLYESTIFERASTTRHKYLTLFKDEHSDDYFIKLNLQIRFNK